MNSKLIAPCGMNCGICLGYLREKNKCPGCRLIEPGTFKYNQKCIIKNCEFYKSGKDRFCYKCDKFPCKRLRDLDKRYRTNYNMSMIENLKNIEENGILKFVSSEKTRWRCECGETICVHRKNCLKCGKPRQ
ncbi:MAG: DUF3795 domain-containing protein [Clostridia bacterium]|nr:DUF3795 domain-containing protein [Clostridia bacterium]